VIVLTAAHRQRLELIRERTKSARHRRQHARELRDAAREAGDQDGEAVAQMRYDEADLDLQTAERLESQMLSAMAGIDGGGFTGATSIFEDPETIERLQRLGNGSFPIGTVDLGPLGSIEELVHTINAGTWGHPSWRRRVTATCRCRTRRGWLRTTASSRSRVGASHCSI
jgi:hypothetical protein